MSFSSLGLAEPLLKAISDLKYTDPTAIQVTTIPVILRGGDVLASAETGSGKTAAFVLPILQSLLTASRDSTRTVPVLILVPTRELAAQVGDSISKCSRYLPIPIKTLIVYGGVSINPQMMAMRGGADIVVATPGRLLDLVEHNAIQLSAVSTFVLDEADRLLALGFADELNCIISLLPTRRQSLFFSATFPEEVKLLAESHLVEPTRIEVASDTSTPSTIEQRAIEVDVGQRTQLLIHLIRENRWTHVLVFVATKYATEHVAEKLRRSGIVAESFHGELSQGARTDTLAAFKCGKVQVLVATDLAARGIDVARLPVVVSYDLPRSPVDYIHRVGRTGRAGEAGVAVSFISASSDAHFRLIEKKNRIALPREQITGFEPVEIEVPAVHPGGGVKGKRKSKKDKLREAAARVNTPEPAKPVFSPARTPRLPLTPIRRRIF